MKQNPIKTYGPFTAMQKVTPPFGNWLPQKAWTRILGVVMAGLLTNCSEPDTSSLKPISFENLPGWNQENFENFWQAFQSSCGKAPDSMKAVCEKAKALKDPSVRIQKQFIEENFTPHTFSESGLFTGYFQPTLKASKTQTETYKYPIYKRPDDLIMIEDLKRFKSNLAGIRIAGRNIDGHLRPYDTRAEIENGSLKDKTLEIAWVDDPIKLYFMHIQGSGCLTYDDGSCQYLSYAATNGHAYTSIGKVLIQHGELTPKNTSMQTIVAWLKKHSDKANDLLNENESYVFFKNSDSDGVIGAQGCPLTPERSLAVDRNHIPLGSLLWLDVEHPKNQKNIQRLALAQDVGGAIKGRVRGDFFWGQGDAAGDLAGLMKSTGTYYILLPRVSHG